MRISVRIIIDAASAKIGGAVSYLKGLLPALGEAMPGHQWIVLVRPEIADALNVEDPNVALIYTSDGGGFLKRIWWRQVTLRRLVKALGADALYSSANFAMFWCPVRQVLLIRNAIYFDDRYVKLCVRRHPFGRRIEYWLRRWLIHAGIRHADAVMTPTESLMAEVRRLAPPRRIAAQVVNPYGVKLRPALPSSEAADSQVDAEPGEPSPGAGARRGCTVIRLLFVSLYADYKNLGTLLKALPILNDTVEGTLFSLTTTADPNPGKAAGPAHEPDESSAKTDEAKLSRHCDIKPWVGYVGPLSREETLKLYGQSDIFVFPSYCESFGHPLVEAMAQGLPIVAADTPVNREMCQDAGVYFNPLDADDMAREIRRVSGDASLRDRASAAGQRRAREVFSWSSHVRRLALCFAPAATRRIDVEAEKSKAVNSAALPVPRHV